MELIRDTHPGPVVVERADRGRIVIRFHCQGIPAGFYLWPPQARRLIDVLTAVLAAPEERRTAQNTEWAAAKRELAKVRSFLGQR